MSTSPSSACGCASGACGVSLTTTDAPLDGDDAHALHAKRERLILGSSALVYALTMFFASNIEAALGIWGLRALYAYIDQRFGKKKKKGNKIALMCS